MILRALWLAVALAACSINHRSDEFACTQPSDCSTGRTCVDGFCVATQVDAGARPDAAQGACPAPCTSCSADARSCTIDCARNPGACNVPITCPTGWSCNIACSTPNACRSGIACSSSRCTITCSGRQSCENITCGLGPCNVQCTGEDSCNDVRCGPSCACDVSCLLVAKCERLECKASQCVGPFGGCTSTGAGCNTCAP